MANRHKKGFKTGGGIAVASGNPYVLDEAKDERKKGGKVMGKMDGPMSRHRLDKPGRKTGGRVGADKAPLSSAHGSASAPSMPKAQVGAKSPD